MPALPYVEIGLVLIALVAGPIGFALGLASGKRIGREAALRAVAELAGKEREALQQRIDSTPKPATAEDALEEL